MPGNSTDQGIFISTRSLCIGSRKSCMPVDLRPLLGPASRTLNVRDEGAKRTTH